ncbi:hypothetical protein C2U31_13945 [Achromobacter sp. AONIH1]|nr:hypothetical protein C2U31_13945 [Achromobacter sp. AONIH1]
MARAGRGIAPGGVQLVAPGTNSQQLVGDTFVKTDQKITLMDLRQTWPEKLASNILTFGLLGLCIWASQGSTWWTFFTALLFLCVLVVRIAAFSHRSKTEFAGIHALKAWVDTEAEREHAERA